MCEASNSFFSTAEVAEAMDVGESSVKRWIDAGRLAAERTPGGHRRVELANLYEFLRQSGKKLVAPEVLGMKSPLKGSIPPIDICEKSLATGDAFTFESMLRTLLLSESSISTILDQTIYPAFLAVRARCMHPSEECMVLHRAIIVAQTTLRAVLGKQRPEKPASARVVLADIGYEVDGIPTVFAEAAVAHQAECLQLGMNVPAEVIEGSLTTFKADVLWLSASGPGRRSVSAQEIQRIVTKAQKRGIKIVVFGEKFPRSLETKATRVNSFGEFSGFIAAISA